MSGWLGMGWTGPTLAATARTDARQAGRALIRGHRLECVVQRDDGGRADEDCFGVCVFCGSSRERRG